MRKSLIALFALALFLIGLGTNHHQVHPVSGKLPLRAGLPASERVTMDLNQTNLVQALVMYSELTGRTELPKHLLERLDESLGGYLSRWHIMKPALRAPSGIEYHRDGLFSVGEVKTHLEMLFAANGLVLVPDGKKHFRVLRSANPAWTIRLSLP